jgi:hypothetical protein
LQPREKNKITTQNGSKLVDFRIKQVDGASQKSITFDVVVYL